VVGTYGRGIWILDDLSALRAWSPAVADAATFLFEPRPAYRFRRGFRRDLAPSGAAMGRNPDYGATLDYALKEPLKGDVKIRVLDASGALLRTLKGTNKAGVNRVVWDLRYEPTRAIELRTTPAGNPHVWEEKRFRGKQTRPVSYYGISDPKRGPLVLPGRYTVRLEAGGQTYERTLEVRKDPNTAGTLADVEASTRLLVDIWRDVNTVVDRVNSLEIVRKQLEDLRVPFAKDAAHAWVLEDMKALDAKLRAVEDQLLQRTLEEADEKSFRGEIQLYLKLLWLAAEAGTGGGDIAGNADFAPTAAELEVYALLKQKLGEVEAEYQKVMEQDVGAFNQKLQAAGIFAVVVPADKP